MPKRPAKGRKPQPAHTPVTSLRIAPALLARADALVPALVGGGEDVGRGRSTVLRLALVEGLHGLEQRTKTKGVTRMDDETKDRIANALSNAVRRDIAKEIYERETLRAQDNFDRQFRTSIHTLIVSELYELAEELKRRGFAYEVGVGAGAIRPDGESPMHATLKIVFEKPHRDPAAIYFWGYRKQQLINIVFDITTERGSHSHHFADGLTLDTLTYDVVQDALATFMEQMGPHLPKIRY